MRFIAILVIAVLTAFSVAACVGQSGSGGATSIDTKEEAIERVKDRLLSLADNDESMEYLDLFLGRDWSASHVPEGFWQVFNLDEGNLQEERQASWYVSTDGTVVPLPEVGKGYALQIEYSLLSYSASGHGLPGDLAVECEWSQ